MRSALKWGSAAALAAVALAASPAPASYTMFLDAGGGNTATVTDHGDGTETITTTGSATGAGVNIAENSGALSYIGMLGTLSITTTTGITGTLSSSPYKAGLMINSTGINLSSAAATLTITLTKTDLQLNVSPTAPPTSAKLSLTSGGSLPAGNSFSATAVVDPNDAGATSGLPDSTVTANGLPGLTSEKEIQLQGTTGGQTDAFSLSIIDSLTFKGHGFCSFSTNADLTVPEPGMLAILASGLPLLGAFGLRRRLAKAAAA